MNYIVYHLHSEESMNDSTTKYKEYILRAKELNQKAIAFTEHGVVTSWIDKKRLCEQNGIKYIHGCEVYLTEKPLWETKVINELNEEEIKYKKRRDNYHTILLAKNWDGVKELNKLVSLSSNDEHRFFKPRIYFDEFFNISDNIIKISACLQSPLWELYNEMLETEDENRRKECDKLLEKLILSYDFLEVQPHIYLDKQKEYNQLLLKWSKQYDKPLIAGTDTHSLNSYDAECRMIVKSSKGMKYEDEDTLDLTYKSVDELISMFEEQKSLPRKEFLQAIENTNLLYDLVEDFELDYNIKYPKLYDNDEEICWQRIVKMFKDKINRGIISQNQIEQFKNDIKTEWETFGIVGMQGFMLFMSELICWCHENGIPTGFSRGSCAGSRIAYVLDIIDINPVDFNLVFSRFCNPYRIEVGDIDIDFSADDREKVYNYIVNRFGEEYTAFILTYQTIKEDGFLDLIGRGLKDENKQRKYSLEEIKKIKKEYKENSEKTKAKYKDIFYYFDGLCGKKVSTGFHPAGIIVSPVNLQEYYGTLYNDSKIVLQIDMEMAHDVNLVKYDILSLKNISIIKDTYKLIGKQYPKYHEINWNDNNVWKDMNKSNIGIFQFEEQYAYNCLKKFNCHSIDDITLVTAAIRPSGASYREDLLNRKIHKNPSDLIDNMLKNNYGYLVFQEDVIAFLQDICGFNGGEADSVRRYIASKNEEKLSEWYPKIIDGYCDKSDKNKEESVKEVEEFVQIIKDSSSYMFGRNHATGYSLISYLCAYIRYYYTYEFICSYLNNAANDRDVIDGQTLANLYGISIFNPKFRYSKSEYYFSKENKAIYKGISSIKHLSKSVGKFLYSIKDIKVENFYELLPVLCNKGHIDSGQMNILIKIDYFSEFGNPKQLLKIYEFWTTFMKQGNVKEISKSSLDSVPKIVQQFISRNSKETAKKYKLNNNNDLDYRQIIDGIMNCYSLWVTNELKDSFSLKEKIKYQQELLGYVTISQLNPNDRFKIIILDMDEIIRKKDNKLCGYRINTMSLGNGKKAELTLWLSVYEKNPFEKYSVLQLSPNSLRKKVSGGFTNWELCFYRIVEQ